MATEAIDISCWQGNINFNVVPQPIIIIKATGGDGGLYVDDKMIQNYYGAKNAGKVVGQYHFAGGGDPIGEADFFLNKISPLEENDVFILDWEIEHANPVGWVQAFMQRIHDRCGVWSIFYTNLSRLNEFDWSPVTQNCGVWVAAYSYSPNTDLPTKYAYIMHQYSSTGSVPGIAGNVDMDMFYGTVEQWKKYGWHAPVVAPPAPVPTPAPVEPPKPVEPPVIKTPPVVVTPPVTPPPKTTPSQPVEPTKPTQPTQTPVSEIKTPQTPLIKVWWEFILRIINIILRKK